jgi:hypothetical protein
LRRIIQLEGGANFKLDSGIIHSGRGAEVNDKYACLKSIQSANNNPATRFCVSHLTLNAADRRENINQSSRVRDFTVTSIRKPIDIRLKLGFINGKLLDYLELVLVRKKLLQVQFCVSPVRLNSELDLASRSKKP